MLPPECAQYASRAEGDSKMSRRRGGALDKQREKMRVRVVKQARKRDTERSFATCIPNHLHSGTRGIAKRDLAQSTFAHVILALFDIDGLRSENGDGREREDEGDTL